MRGRMLTGFGWTMATALSLAAPAAAQGTTEGSSGPPTGLGPLEVAPVPFAGGGGVFLGNLGAPRAAVPETRFGVLLDWMMASSPDPSSDWTAHVLNLVVEAHLELFEDLEVGLDLEVLEAVKTSEGGTSNSTTDFGFITPRVKYALVNGEVVTFSMGFGMALPTASDERLAGLAVLGFELGFYLAVRPLDFVSINLSIPVTNTLLIHDGEADVGAVELTPSIGVAVMPLDVIGGFVDLDFSIVPYPLHESMESPEPLEMMDVVLGVRSKFLPWMMAELGVVIPVAGPFSDFYDAGLSFRIAATPDLL